jgi:hypothetical protein
MSHLSNHSLSLHPLLCPSWNCGPHLLFSGEMGPSALVKHPYNLRLANPEAPSFRADIIPPFSCQNTHAWATWVHYIANPLYTSNVAYWQLRTVVAASLLQYRWLLYSRVLHTQIQQPQIKNNLEKNCTCTTKHIHFLYGHYFLNNTVWQLFK